jgi:predicted DNA repair protein MutK
MVRYLITFLVTAATSITATAQNDTTATKKAAGVVNA